MNLLSELFIIGLATGRLCMLLTWEDGPWYIFVRLREWSTADLVVPETFLGKLLECHLCLSVWVAFILYIGYLLWLPVLGFYMILAISMISILANKYTNE